MAQAIEQLVGFALGALVLADIFLLVLYARAEAGLISRLLPYWIWRVLVWVSKPWGRRQGSFLAFSGPIILVALLSTWALLLSLATALVIHPNLGTGVRSTSGNTPTDFVTALYVGGSSLSFIGASDFVPQTGYFRLFYLITSLIGLSLVTLTVTYLMELYAGLRARNSAALKVHLLSRETGDAAEVIAGLGLRGAFDASYLHLAEWAAEMAEVKESHHFYPILYYFRFREPFYSLSRTTLISLDTVTLIRSALDDQEYGWLKQSAAVEDLWHGSLLELKALAANLMVDLEQEVPPDEPTRTRWQLRYTAGVAHLRLAGIKATASGLDRYVALRTQWDRYITELAPRFAYRLDEIDTAVAKIG